MQAGIPGRLFVSLIFYLQQRRSFGMFFVRVCSATTWWGELAVMDWRTVFRFFFGSLWSSLWILSFAFGKMFFFFAVGKIFLANKKGSERVSEQAVTFWMMFCPPELWPVSCFTSCFVYFSFIFCLFFFVVLVVLVVLVIYLFTYSVRSKYILLGHTVVLYDVGINGPLSFYIGLNRVLEDTDWNGTSYMRVYPSHSTFAVSFLMWALTWYSPLVCLMFFSFFFW